MQVTVTLQQHVSCGHTGKNFDYKQFNLVLNLAHFSLQFFFLHY